MMPFSKEKNRRIYITAIIISFLLIVGSIILHLKQKTHLGRMSFSKDLDHVKPTSGVDQTTWMDNNDSTFINGTNEILKKENEADESDDFKKPSSTENNDVTTIHYARSRQYESNADISEENYKINNRNDDEDNDNDSDNMDEIVNEDNKNYDFEIKLVEQNSNACLRCLCMTVNECRPTFCGSGNPCGLYRISKSYWIDSGRPTIIGGSTYNEDQDYLTCVNEDMCSTTVIRQYYNRYKRDCDADGKLDCRDQITLHLLGPSGCLIENLSNIHENRMKNCLVESYYLAYSEEEPAYVK